MNKCKIDAASKSTSFKMALLNAGLTYRQFSKRLGCSHTMISLVLSGQRKSARIKTACNLFIKKEFNKMKTSARGGVGAQKTLDSSTQKRNQI